MKIDFVELKFPLIDFVELKVLSKKGILLKGGILSYTVKLK
jgi:hypothetical protein